MGLIVAEIFWVGALPCVVAAAMTTARRFVLHPEAVWTTSVGGAFIVGMFALAARNGWSAAFDSLIRPNEASEWLPWLVLLAIGVDVLTVYLPTSQQLWIAATACLFALVVPVRLLAGTRYVSVDWSSVQKIGVLALWTVVLSAMWFSLAAGRTKGQPRLRSGLLIIVAGGAALVITLCGSFAVGRLAGIVAAALAGVLLAELAFNRMGATGSAGADSDGLSGAAGVVTVALGGVAILAYYFVLLIKHSVAFSTTVVALLVVAIVAAGGWLPTTWLRRPLAQAAFRAALALVPLAIAFYLAFAAVQADQANPYAS